MEVITSALIFLGIFFIILIGIKMDNKPNKYKKSQKSIPSPLFRKTTLEKKRRAENSKNVRKSKKGRKRDKIKYAYHGLRCYTKNLTNGEKEVVHYLSNDLDTRRYYIFNNLTLRTKDGSTQIDHVIVSPYGIFVVETKDYSGWIFGDKEGKVWTQSFPNGKKFTFQNPYHQNYKHIKTLQNYLPFIPNTCYKNIIAFSRKSDFKIKKPQEVKYFDELSFYIQGFDQKILSNSQFFMTIGKLSQLCQSTNISPEIHNDNLKKVHSKKYSPSLH